MLFQMSIRSKAGPIKVDHAIKWMLFSKGIASCFPLSREPEEQESGGSNDINNLIGSLQRETLSHSGCIKMDSERLTNTN